MSTSPSSCPDLHFSDCFLTEPSSSPEVRRPRGAPWASRRPRPFVDKLVVQHCTEKSKHIPQTQNTLPSLRQDPVPTDDCPSPPKRRNIQKAKTSETREEASTKHQKKNEEELLRTLFPEVLDSITQEKADPRTETTQDATKPARPVARKSIIRNRQSDCRSWISIRDPHASTPEQPDLPPVLPVTPPRPLTSSTYQVTTEDGTINTAASRSFKTVNSSVGTYATKNSNRSILRSVAVHNFQQVTGVTTASRLQAAAELHSEANSDSEEEEDAEKEDAAVPSQTSMIVEQVQNDEEEIDFFSGGATNHAANDDHAPDYYPAIPDHATEEEENNELYEDARQQESHRSEMIQAHSPKETCLSANNGNPERRTRGTVNRKSTTMSTKDTENRLSTPSSRGFKVKASSLRLPGRLLTAITTQRTGIDSTQQARTQLDDKHDKYKQYVYERIHPYPHIRDEDAPREGHKALEMGYLVPPPREKAHAPKASHESDQDEDTIRNLKLKILGRTSQTEFRVFQTVERKLRDKINLDIKKKKKTTKKARKEQQQDSDSEECDGPASERKKPLSHLNVFAVVNQSIEGLPLPQDRRPQTLKSMKREESTKTTNVATFKQKKSKRSKKVQLPRGHRPLRLEYSHAKMQHQADDVDGEEALEHNDVPMAGPDEHAFTPDRESGVGTPQQASPGHFQPSPARPLQQSRQLQSVVDADAAFSFPRYQPPKSARVLVLATQMNDISQKHVSHTRRQDLHAATQNSRASPASPPHRNPALTQPRQAQADLHVQEQLQIQEDVHVQEDRHVLDDLPNKTHLEVQEHLQFHTPSRQTQNVCDVLMPLSSHQTGKQSLCPFTLRTTNATTALTHASHLAASSENFNLQEDMSSLPSDLFFNSENRREIARTGHSRLSDRSLRRQESLTAPARVILAASSSDVTRPSRQQVYESTALSARPGRSSQKYWSATETQGSEVPRVRPRVHRFDSYESSEEDDDSEESEHSAHDGYSTPPYPTQALLADVVSRSQLFLKALQAKEASPVEEDFGPDPESDLTPPENMGSYEHPVPHQECYTPGPTDEEIMRTQVQVCTVPSDVEIEYHEELQARSRLEMPLEIPTSLAPVPDSPEEATLGVDTTLQAKLDRYGRRVVGFKALATRRRPPSKRAIPQDTPPFPNNDQMRSTNRAVPLEANNIASVPS